MRPILVMVIFRSLNRFDLKGCQTLLIFLLSSLVLNLLIASSLYALPVTSDDNLSVEQVLSAPFKPTTFAFLENNDFLILDRDEGKVYEVVDKKLISEPILDVNVATVGYRGMLGIAISYRGINTEVFLFYTESQEKDGDDEGGFEPFGNRVYKYDLVDGKLQSDLSNNGSELC
jgi:hypothetical protein